MMIIMIMKKIILSVLLFLASSYSDVMAQVTGEDIGEEIVLQVGIIDPTEQNDPIKRSPIRIPSVRIEDHTLYFITSCDGCRLRLFNEDGELQYVITIPENSESIELPSYLTGEYEIQFIRGRYCFYGYITL